MNSKIEKPGSVLFITSFLIFASSITIKGQANEDSVRAEIQLIIEQADSLREISLYDSAIVLGNIALNKALDEFGEQDTTVANALTLLGLCLEATSNYKECELSWSKALAIIEKILGPEHPKIAQSLNYVAAIYIRQNKYAEAEKLLERSLEILDKTDSPGYPEKAKSLNSIAIICRKQGRNAESEQYFKRSLQIYEDVLGPDHPTVAKGLNSLANLYKNEGRYAESEQLYKRAIRITENSSGFKSEKLGGPLYNLGSLYMTLGRFAEADSALNRAIKIWENTFGPDHIYVAMGYGVLGSCYRLQGKYADVIPFFKKDLQIQERIYGSDHTNVALALNNLGAAYYDQGMNAEAESYYKRALEIYDASPNNADPDLALTLNNLATLYDTIGKFNLAEQYFGRALLFTEEVFGADHKEMATLKLNLGLMYAHQGKYTEAETVWVQTREIYEKTLGLEHPSLANTLSFLGDNCYSLGRYAEAESLYLQALFIREKTLDPSNDKVTESLNNLANLYAATGEFEKSVANFKKHQNSRQNFIKYVFSYASEDLKMRYIQKYPIIGNSFLSFALLNTAAESKESAIGMILNGKAIILDAVSAEKEIAYCSYNDEIIARAEKHTEICGEIATLSLAGAESLEPEIYRDRLQTLYGIKDSLESELSRDCAEFRDELAGKRFTVEDVADALPDNAILWEFVQYNPYDFKKIGSDKERTGPPRYLAFTLNHAGEITLTDLGDAAEIDSLITLARKMIYRSGSEVRAIGEIASEKRLTEVTGRLYDLIFAPLESSLAEKTQIFISQDGQLHLLPYEILTDHEGRYAIEKYEISYLSSGRDLLRFKKKPEYGNWALAIADPDFDLSREMMVEHKEKTNIESGFIEFAYEPSRGASSCLNGRFDPLPYTQKETKSVVKTLKKKANLEVDSYYGERSLEAVLKGMKIPPRILHLSTHGYFCEDIDLTENKMLENPLLRSGLILAGANRILNASERDTSQSEDGILTAFEVSGLNLFGTELVTLSACETGVGEVKNGEGVFGLRRAFQQAGAKTILMSLWKIPDKETSDIMNNFYENWSAGQAKHIAFRQAVLKLLNERRDKHGAAHPYFWGGFVLLGDPN